MNKPNTDIASDGSLAGALSSAFRNLMMNTEDMLPATVVSYDDKTTGDDGNNGRGNSRASTIGQHSRF